ncbi:MAG: hypothetical protein LBN99_01945 [Oscillospiraceae bacterium]|jgi:hypothetical protein|nr:hypothetical protein [Oscillospiraceae bacterium]
MSSKFDHLFFEFKPQYTNWGDWCHSPQAYFRGEADMPGANLTVGFQVFTAPVYLEREPHFHREEEYLVFLGHTLPDVFASFDAEVEFFIGPTIDTMEKITVTKPTIIRVPPGMWHSPLDFKRVDKPILFQAASQHGKFGSIKQRKNADGFLEYIYTGDEARGCILEPGKQCNYCGKCFGEATKDSVTSEQLFSKPGADFEQYWTVLDQPLSQKIKDLICELPKEETQWGPWCPTPQAYFRGETYMPAGCKYHVGFQVFTGPNDMEEAHFHQGVDEYIFFMGADPMNIFDFDADIDFYIGDHPDHMELHKITKPTVVRLPPTVWHSPILFKRVTKPLLFQAAFLDGVWGTITRRYNEKGEPFYNYTGDNVRWCRYEPEKRCNICGRCFADDSAPLYK